MITAGIDVGVENTKAVVLKDGTIIGKAKGPSGFADRPVMIDAVYKEALKAADVEADDIDSVVATGKGKFQTEIADKMMTEQIAAARAARYFKPEATSVVSLGADETMVATLGEGDRIDEFVYNQKCTSGIGLFIEYTADRLGLDIEEVSALPKTEPAVNEGCAVFADLGVLELLNQGASVTEAASAAINAAAVRIDSVINDITNPNRDVVVLVGGPARNAALVNTLKEYSGIDFVIPDEAEYAGAVGAALPR
jgi:predicted CoA-substrate-specific enzyme activase